MTSGMTVTAFEPTIGAPHLTPGLHAVPMSRPQVGIERLPTRRLSNEPRESMNCKSCRKRKIKCNRLRPACEACQVFQCPCIYDAVPKKRGPKTDVLEALLKRVDGLEQRLKDQKKTAASPTEEPAVADGEDTTPGSGEDLAGAPKLKLQPTEAKRPIDSAEAPGYSPSQPSEPPSPQVQTDTLLDTYFARFHAKPYHVLDESSVRQRLQLNQVPLYLMHAIYAVAARYTAHPNGYQAAVRLSEDYATRARIELDTDEPSVDALQSLLLLVTAFTAAGKGKKAYMLLSYAVGMAMALELHREMDAHARVTPVEREMRRRLFWTCYLLDRFMACGSKRPSLIGDRIVLLRLPCWSPTPGSHPIEGEFFQSGSNLQYLQGSGKKCQGSSGMLIDITRILGVTNQYLAAGGVKGDSHFPWHSLSTLSKIRHDLDIWASGTNDVFSSLDSLFGQTDSTVLVLSKLVYHLIHCLIYRPFLPIDLAELAGTGQHQSWQIESTNMCFLHANAIAELVELGKQTPMIEWPAFVGYCICTAGTVHVHGAHYNKNGMAGEMSVFSSSTDFLSREMQQLSELRYAWAIVQHQRETLQGIYNAHAELVKSLANNPVRYAPVFHVDDFFDRYANAGSPGGQTFNFDAATLSVSDVIVDFAADAYVGHDLYAPRTNGTTDTGHERPSLKRKKTAASLQLKRQDSKSLQSLATSNLPRTSHSMATSSHSMSSFPAATFQPHASAPVLRTPGGLPPHHGMADPTQAGGPPRPLNNAAGFPLPPQHISTLPDGPFGPRYNYADLAGPGPNVEAAAETQTQVATPSASYDPMFGTLEANAFASPAAWQGDEAAVRTARAARNAEERSSSSAEPGTGEEKDPFLSLLEELAENEHARGPGNELDFFLAAAPNGN